MDKREIVRVLLEVTLHKGTKRGRRFDPWRVEVSPGDFLLSSWRDAGDDFDPSEHHFGEAGQDPLDEEVLTLENDEFGAQHR